MSGLREVLLARIRADGPLRVSDYMAECLLNPRHGYYTTREVFGRAGDFITAPEISQMFGELVGLALAQAWLDQGRPAPFTLAELGPGRGTLMADAWRAAGQVPGFQAAARICLVEASDRLREVQAKTLEACGAAPAWVGSVHDLPEQPTFAVANEFFDALPIRQFQRDGDGWRERRVGAVAGRLQFGLAGRAPQPALAHRLEDTRDGDIVEIAPALPAIATALGRRIEAHGGCALIVDYGDWRSLGDTLQAVRGHARQDPLEAPGEADLTAHVDFEAIADAAPCAHSRLTPQGVWLERLGITARAQALARGLEGPALETHVAAHRRLTHPDEMGRLFKLLALYPTASPPPPGVDA